MPRIGNRLSKCRKGKGGRGKKSENTASQNDVAAKPRPRPTKPSSSSKKIDFGNYDDFISDENHGNEIIDINLLSQSLMRVSLCKNCKKYGLQIRSSQIAGVASKLDIYCAHCQASETLCSSTKTEITGKTFYDVNIRMAYGLRSIGKGLTAGRTLCGILNLPQPPMKFLPYNGLLRDKCKEIAYQSMKNAVEEAVSEHSSVIKEEQIENPDFSENPRDISAGFDGSWQRRGFKSLNGVVSCTSIESGKIMDVEVLSKYCTCLDQANHEADCMANYQGTSGGMESFGAQKIVGRSEEKFNVRFTKYLGDGDSNSFASIVANNPYKDIKIEKLECVNHVSKRMGARLRRLKQDQKGEKLEDGKSLGGKNRLTDDLINKIKNYYGRAIKENKNDLNGMKTAVWRIFFHMSSTDSKPCHGLCPKGEMSWCKYNKAVAEGKQYSHKNILPEAIMNAIKPTFRALADPNLLKKCLHNTTQNVNESFNHVIWTRVPKNTFVTIRTLEFGVYDAVSTYNDGNIAKCRVLKSIGIQPGAHMVAAMKSLDSDRVRDAEKGVSEYTRQARRRERIKKRKLEMSCSGTTEYDPGMH